MRLSIGKYNKLKSEIHMATDYVRKINGKPIAASEVVPSSSLENKINNKYQLIPYGTWQYSDVTTVINSGKVPVIYRDNSLYVYDGSVYTVNNANEYRFTKASGNVDSPRIYYLRIRDNSSGWGDGVVTMATPNSVTTVADSRFPYYTVDNPNWDDLTSIGEYKVTNSDSTGTAKNSPERGAINARVYNINDGSTPFITQIAVGDDMYYRSKYGNSAWSAWRYFPQSNTVRRIEQGSLGSSTDTLYIV